VTTSHFFAAGGVVLALYPWDKLAEDAEVPVEPRPSAFRGTTLAWNCASAEAVDGAFARAIASGGRAHKRPQATLWGGYSGYFADLDEHPWEMVRAPMFPLNPQGMLTLPS
jgi:uncharacterized glyoxalase superfamily protein PhnB